MTLKDIIRTHGKEAARALIGDLIGGMKDVCHNALPDDKYPNFDDSAVQEHVENAMAYWEGELVQSLHYYLDNTIDDMENDPLEI